MSDLSPRMAYDVYGWDAHRPLTRIAFVYDWVRQQRECGGIAPSSWHLPTECAEELAKDCADSFVLMGGFRDRSGNPAAPPTFPELLREMKSEDPPRLMGVRIISSDDATVGRVVVKYHNESMMQLGANRIASEAEDTAAQDRALIQDAFRALTRLAERLDPTTELYQFSPKLPPRVTK